MGVFEPEVRDLSPLSSNTHTRLVVLETILLVKNFLGVLEYNYKLS